jgi:predicted ATP-grasp superfamily ATP-dependent carboligase
MEGYATRLLKHFNWHGVAMVEFKLNHQGEPFLLEVNPRFWGSINQAVQAGVDFPYLLYQLAVDGDVRPVLSYREGVVTRNSLLDICSYIHGMVSKSPTMNPNPYIQFPYFDDIFSIDDPAPIFAAIKSIRRNSNILRNSNPAE